LEDGIAIQVREGPGSRRDKGMNLGDISRGRPICISFPLKF